MYERINYSVQLETVLTCPFTTLAANCMIIDSTLYAQHHPLGVRSSMQIAPPCITKPCSILGEITLMKGGANGNSFGKITFNSIWGIFSSRMSAASLLSGSILCNRTDHSKTLSLTSSAVKAESPWRCALWILLNSFISRRRPTSLSLTTLHSLLSCANRPDLRLSEYSKNDYRIKEAVYF